MLLDVCRNCPAPHVGAVVVVVEVVVDVVVLVVVDVVLVLVPSHDDCPVWPAVFVPALQAVQDVL